MVESCGGLIVTIPHKTSILALCDRVVGDAAEIGAVNTIRRGPRWQPVGAMLDGKGFVSGLVVNGIDVAGMDACLLGAGGAGRRSPSRAGRGGARRLTIVNRSQEKARDLARRISDRYPAVRVDGGRVRDRQPRPDRERDLAGAEGGRRSCPWTILPSVPARSSPRRSWNPR